MLHVKVHPDVSLAETQSTVRSGAVLWHCGALTETTQGVLEAGATAVLEAGVAAVLEAGVASGVAAVLTGAFCAQAAVSGAGLSDWLSYYGTNEIDTWMIPYFGASVYDDPSVYAKSSPINYIKQVKTPTLMVAGDRDAEVPVTQSYEYWHALRDLGVPTQLVIYPGEGHLFYKPADQQDVARRIVTWFDHKLP